MTWARLGAAIAVAWVPAAAAALPPPPEVAEPLKAWIGWALHDHPELHCASWGEGRACAWPGHLAVAIEARTGTFSLDVWLDRDGPVALPGDAQAWPQVVQADGQAAPVLAVDGRPTVRLPAGHHRVDGTFLWSDPPELLALPKEVGTVALTLRGAKIDAPRRDESGRLLVQKDGAGPAAETDSLSIAVARRIFDGVPLRMTTRLTLRAGGKARDAVLGQVLPPGWRPIAVQCKLPVQVGGDGAVRVHVRPGQHTLDLDAVRADAAAGLSVPTLAGEHFELPEVWVWQPDESLRSVELGGLSPVDPERTQLDAEWKKGRAFLAAPGQTLTLRQTRRGEVEPPPNAVHLVRQWWLDLDGKGLTSSDKLTGQLHQGWRLQTAPDWQLGRAATGGRDQLVTLAGAATAAAGSGVELRAGAIALDADLRTARVDGAIRAVGWATDVQSLKATLHLPPGWTLLGARGVDQLPTTWSDSWTLLDFFFVLMVAAGFARLVGKGWAAAIVAALVLCHGEADAPQAIWLWALAALGLLAVLPESKFRKVVVLGYGVILFALVIDVVPFAAAQLRHGIYPQTGTTARDSGFLRAEDIAPAAVEAPAAPPAATAVDRASVDGKDKAADVAQEANVELANVPVQQKADRSLRRAKAAKGGRGWLASDYDYLSTAGENTRQLQQIDPHAVVQTGPGVPTWSWSSWPLTWHGPVRADHEITLYLLSPTANLVLAILRALLVIAIAVRLLDLQRLRRLAGSLQVAAPAVLALTAALAGSVPADASEPDDGPRAELIGQLRDRLVAAQQCEGPCLVVSHLKIGVEAGRATLSADVSAQRPVGWVIPGPVDALQIDSVQIDGAPTRALRRDEQGLLRVRVPPGRHLVAVGGALARRSVVDLQLGSDALPRRVEFDGRGWTIDGLDAHGVPQQSLQLTRREVALPTAPTAGAAALAAAATATDAAIELPPWYAVERHLVLGLPWTVKTVVERIDADRPGLVKIPLLQGEVVLSEDVRVEEVEPGRADAGRRAVVSFARGERQVVFTGQLPIPDAGRARIALAAPASEPWTETWRLDCSPLWQCAWKGVAPTHTRDPNDAALRPVWQPWPGESLSLDIGRPPGAPGQSVTVDRVDYAVEPGQRLLAATLELHVRASQGGARTITLPEGAEVRSVSYDGKDKTLRPRGRALDLPLGTGAQTIVVRWQQPWDRAIREAVPPIDLGGPAANVLTHLKVGESRWLIGAWGPAWGAAVLFWSRLILLALLAVALGRVQGPPLRTHHWLLLGLGLGPLPMPLPLAVVGWFLALAWRRRYGIAGRDGSGTLFPTLGHNLLQLFLFGWGLFALGTLYGAIHNGLLLDLDMQVEGAGSTERELRWISNRTAGPLPAAGMISLPLWVWRGLMLAWALWLVAALLRWLPWAWRALVSGSGWLPWPRTLAASEGPAAPAADPSPPPVPPAPPPAPPDPPTTAAAGEGSERRDEG